MLQYFALYLPLELEQTKSEGPVKAPIIAAYGANIARLLLFSNKILDLFCNNRKMMTKEYAELFKERKWKRALDAMPLNIPKVVLVENAGDLLTLRSRASDFSRESKDKKASVSIDLDEKQAIVTVTKK